MQQLSTPRPRNYLVRSTRASTKVALKRLHERLRRGLTLIELMIGMAITATLLTMASPYFVDFINNSRLREGGNSVMAEALYAQSEALKRNGTVRLTVNSTSTQVIDMTGAAPVTLRTRMLTNGLSATALNVDFGSDGMTRPRGTEASVDVSYGSVSCSNDQRCPRLRVEAGGSIRLCGNKLSCS